MLYRSPDNPDICWIPVPSESPNIPISLNDFRTLKKDTWVSDPIIDGTLCLMKLHMLQYKDSKRVYVYPTYLYKRRILGMKGTTFKWTRNVDIFEKEMLVFPMCDDTH